MRKRVAQGMVVLLVVVAAVLLAVRMDWFGRPEVDGEMAMTPRPPAVVASQAAEQAATAASVGAGAGKQVLFGDFHVHTTFSFDSFMIIVFLLIKGGRRFCGGQKVKFVIFVVVVGAHCFSLI